MFLQFFLYTHAISQSSLFVRVYDLNKTKIFKGNISAITDSTIQLGKTNTIIPVKNIGYIKTKHSAGHNVLVGTAITTGVMLTLFAATSTNKAGFLNYDLGQAIALGLITGAVYGPIFGGASALFKKTKTFPINGNAKNWKEFELYYAEYK